MCMCMCVQFCLRSFSTRLVCGFLSGNQRLMGTRLCLLTAYPAILESKGERGGAKYQAAFLVKKKKIKKKIKQKPLTLALLWGITKTFTGKQALSAHCGDHFGENRDTFGQISQVEPSKAVSACTQRRGSKDHLETSDDIRLSVNYSNKHAREWHLTLDVSPMGTLVDASNSYKELWYTNRAENKQRAQHRKLCMMRPFGMQSRTATHVCHQQCGENSRETRERDVKTGFHGVTVFCMQAHGSKCDTVPSLYIPFCTNHIWDHIWSSFYYIPCYNWWCNKANTTAINVYNFSNCMNLDGGNTGSQWGQPSNWAPS